MPLIFPSNPTTGQSYQSGSSATYQWNGSYWATVLPPNQTVLNAVSSSFSVSSSRSTSTPFATSASYAGTASLLLGTIESASFAISSSRAASSITSSYLDGAVPTYIQAGNSSGQSIPANTLTTITGWTNQVAQNAAEWNATTGVFTATKAGTYLVSLGISYSDVGAAGINREYACIITKNGFTQATGWAFTPLTNSVWRALSPATVLVTVVPGDTITARAYQNITGGAVNLAARADVNILTIQELPSRITR